MLQLFYFEESTNFVYIFNYKVTFFIHFIKHPQLRLQVLQAKDEISNMDLSRRLPKITVPLNATIEDIIIYNEELENLDLTNNSVD